MSNNLAYNIYAQNNVNVESPVKLIEMMYEGILRFNMQAKKAIMDNDIEKRTYWIKRSSAILIELINTLDASQGQIAEYLEGLYTHELQELGLAGVENDPSKIDGVNVVVRGLLDAWRETNAMAR